MAVHPDRESIQSLIKYEPVEETVAKPVEEYVEPATSFEAAEKKVVEAALRRHKGNKKLAAEELNISQRTLYRKIHELGLDLAGEPTDANS